MRTPCCFLKLLSGRSVSEEFLLLQKLKNTMWTF